MYVLNSSWAVVSDRRWGWGPTLAQALAQPCQDQGSSHTWLQLPYLQEKGPLRSLPCQ